MEETINLKDFILILKRWWKLIASIILIFGLTSGIISYYFLTPVYEVSTQILVSQKDSEDRIDIAQLNSNIETYSVIIKSPAVLEKVIENLNLDQNMGELNKNITVSSQGNSQVFTVTVHDSNLSDAVRIANNVSETFQTEIQGIMNVDNVSILTKAQLIEGTAPIKPKPLLNIAVGIVAGLIIGVSLVLLYEYLDNRFKDSQEVELYLGLPVLGVVPRITEKERKRPEIKKSGVESLGSKG